MTVESSVAALFERRLRSPSSNRTNASRGWPQRRPLSSSIPCRGSMQPTV
jgi:hypothetical protein